jgi:hypothetical protein
MNQYHKNLSLARWRKFSIFEQMANIGSEVFRALKWKRINQNDSQLAFERALELFYLTVADSKNKNRLTELCRLRESFIDFYLFKNIYKTDRNFWQDYFYAFNYAARLEKI